MPQFERIQKSATRREREPAATTFPEEYASVRPYGGDDPDIEELIERIDRVISEQAARQLGRVASDHE